jgi:hypothetical protein
MTRRFIETASSGLDQPEFVVGLKGPPASASHHHFAKNESQTLAFPSRKRILL